MQGIASVWPLVLTSAAIAAIVSSGATLVGQAIERRSRRRELLLTKAIELARAKSERAVWIAERTGTSVRLQDDIVSAETYFRWLTHLFDKGILPADPAIQRMHRGPHGEERVS